MSVGDVAADDRAYVSEQLIAAQPPPPEARRWSKARIAGLILLGIWTAVAAGLVLFFIREWNPSLLQRYGPRLLHGLLVTIELVGIAVIVGAALACLVGAARLSRNKFIGTFAYAYVYFFRGTPLLAQTFLVYYGAGQFRDSFEAAGLWWFFRDAFNCAALTFTLNTAAYQAEIFQGAIRGVQRGQWEGARALGLSRTVIFFKVIAPQALITALRPLGNEIIFMIKGSAIASVITVYDLMGETRLAFSRSFDFQVYLWAAGLYLILVETLRRFWDAFEARLTRHLKRAEQTPKGKRVVDTQMGA
ncbi:ABC transporter permease [Afifella sp. IM 167]|uniref:ABC transporter permease n=1 Tax=Afifella sp. IM 167 TaxID=2033586 RepID=UPI001CCD08A0|nr:ABC transporter permease [Afifella sp. IM 167]MBZ8134164.1 amino acid ABC transporter permease [Afifella sp. IM 167]